jgi:hypothetical protein
MNTRYVLSLAARGIALLSLASFVMVNEEVPTRTDDSAITVESQGRGIGAETGRFLHGNTANVPAEYPEEWDALMRLYLNTHGEAWLNKTGWQTDTPYCE